MERFKRILLYADPAAEIEPALRYAARVGRHNHGVVTVVDCLKTPDDTSSPHRQINPHSPECVEPLREHAAVRSAVGQETHARLAAICEQLRGQGVPAFTELLVGRPGIEVTREVLRSGHDVVIKTAQGHRENNEKPLFGTTAIHLMRKCPCPVWVVDPDETDRVDRILAAVDPMTDDTDHTKLNAEVVDLAADLAAWEGGELHVAHAWVPYGATVLSSRMPEESLSKYIEGGRRSVQERMADLLARFGKRISPHGVHLLPGDPGQAIPDFVLQRGIDLVVYKFETGHVFGYDPHRGQYEVVGQGLAKRDKSRPRLQ